MSTIHPIVSNKVIGIQVEIFTLAPNETKIFEFNNPTLVNGTIRIENESNIPPNTILNLDMLNVGDSILQNYQLTNQRYGIYFDDKPLYYARFINNNQTSIQVYFEYLLKPFREIQNEIVQWITQLNTVGTPNTQTLYSGTNNRYQGTLSGATFLSSAAIGTFMAVRAINASGSSSTTYGTVDIAFNNFLQFHANLEPLGGLNLTKQTIAFEVDSTTNLLPTSATLSNATVTFIMIDYLFSFTVTMSFPSITINNGNTSSSISFSGQVFSYYFTNPNLPLNNTNISLTQTNSLFTLSPTSGTTGSNGIFSFTLSQALNATSNLADTLTATATQSGLTNTVSASLPAFSFSITSSSSQPNNGDITFTTNQSLTKDVISYGNITINSGVTITTNGYSFICNGTFTNNGTINANTNPNSLGGFTQPGQTRSPDSFTSSYGGSGGGGGQYSGNIGNPAQSGGSTTVSGGTVGVNGNGNPGNSASTPSLTSSLISTWYSNGIQNYLTGAGGGGGGSGTQLVNNYGGNGGYGLFIQANKIIAGTINSIAGSGDSTGGNVNSGGGGGAGGGSLLLVYGSGGYTSGSYNLSGGAEGIGAPGAGNGGIGGNGITITYNYSTQPIPFDITATLNSAQGTIGNQTISFSVTSGTATVSPTSATSANNGTATTAIISSSTPSFQITSSATIAGTTNTSAINFNAITY